MATFVKRGKKIQARVRLGSYRDKPLIKTFDTKKEAEIWANEEEAKILKEQHTDDRALKVEYFRDWINRYEDEFSKPKGDIWDRVEKYRFSKHRKELGDINVLKVTDVTLYEHFKKRRLVDGVSPDTVIKEIQDINNIFTTAKILWKKPITDNPMKDARAMLTKTGLLEGSNLQRDRRLLDTEYQLIKKANPVSKNGRVSFIKYVILFTIETGMRRGEVFGLRWRDVDGETQVARLETQKTDKTRKTKTTGRLVPLSRRAMAILRLVYKLSANRKKVTDMSKDPERVFGFWTDPGNMTQAGTRLLKRLGIKDFAPLHGGRHEFGSAMAEEGVDIRVSSKAMGHVDFRSMARYSHPELDEVAKALNKKRRN